jgi:YVTN family beta-propeller protein
LWARKSGSWTISVLVVLLLAATVTILGARPATSLSSSDPQVTNVKVGLQPWDLLYNPSNGYVYVADVQSCPESGDMTICNAPGTVSVISGAKVVANVTVGTAPVALAYDSLDHYVYELDSTNNVTVISGTQIVGTVEVPASPSSMLYDPSDDYLYVSNFDHSTGEGVVSVISGTTLLGTIQGIGYSSAMTYDASNHYAYIASSNAVYLVSGLKVVAQSSPSVGNAQQLLYDPANGYVYAANFNDPSVTILDNATLIGNATMPKGSTPSALAYDPQNNYVYVANYWNDTVAAITGTTVVATIAVGQIPDSVFYNPMTQEIYVTYDNSDDNISVISGTSLVGNVTVGQGPISPVYDPSDNEVYIADSGSNEVSVLAYTTAESTSVSSSSSSSSIIIGLAVVLVAVAAAVTALYMGRSRRPNNTRADPDTDSGPEVHLSRDRTRDPAQSRPKDGHLSIDYARTKLLMKN